MAGDWIKLEHATADKPEVFRISETLSIAPEHALGCLIRIWVWADQQIEKGNALSVTETTIDRIARVTGFGQAMTNAGWLSVTESEVSFPNFERHNGQTSKTRALTAKRVAKHKAEKGNDKVTLPPLPREEKRREEKIIGEVSPITPLAAPRRKRERRIPVTAADILNDLEIPAELGHDTGSKQAIRDWLEHKDRIRNQYASAKSFAVELARWAKIGPERFACAVAYSIGKEWKGIYEEQVNGNGRGGNAGGHRKSAADGWHIGPGQRYQGPDEPVSSPEGEDSGDSGITTEQAALPY
jgi:hypothetical protein